MAIRGQGYAPQELADFVYREKFGLSYEQFMNEPHDVYQRNLTILELKLQALKEANRRK